MEQRFEHAFDRVRVETLDEGKPLDENKGQLFIGGQKLHREDQGWELIQLTPHPSGPAGSFIAAWKRPVK